MGNAIWLLSAVPAWYFSTLFSPFSGGALTIFPAVSIICLAVGVALAFKRREKGVLLFFISFLASEALAFVAGIHRGMCKADDANLLLLLFLFSQIVGISSLIHFLKDARNSAALLAVFSITYALFAAFAAAMSLSDSWL